MAGKRQFRAGSEGERIGKALSQMMTEAHLSQRDLASELGVSVPTVNRWCSGDILASRDNIAGAEKTCGRPGGYVERLAGYVVDPSSTREAIAGSDEVNEGYRRIALRVWDECVMGTIEEEEERQQRTKRRRSG